MWRMKRVGSRISEEIRFHNPVKPLARAVAVVNDEQLVRDVRVGPSLPVFRPHVDAAGLSAVRIFETDVDHLVPNLGAEAQSLASLARGVQVFVEHLSPRSKQPADVADRRLAGVALTPPRGPRPVAFPLCITHIGLERASGAAGAPTNFGADRDIEPERHAIVGDIPPRPVVADEREVQVVHLSLILSLPHQSFCALIDLPKRVTLRRTANGDGRDWHITHDVRPSTARPHLTQMNVGGQVDRLPAGAVRAELSEPLAFNRRWHVHPGDCFGRFPARLVLRRSVRGSTPVPPLFGECRGRHQKQRQKHCDELAHQYSSFCTAPGMGRLHSFASAYAAELLVLRRAIQARTLVLNRVASHKLCNDYESITL